MKPLALMAQDAGLTVVGSDLNEDSFDEDFRIGAQDGIFLQEYHKQTGVDWYIHSSSVQADNAELVMAQKLGLRISKRDELINYLMKKLNLKMVAVAGTHGKTTTTAMIVWAAYQLGLPISYLVGSSLSFAPAGSYNKNSKFLVYEADEYDRNFLHFKPTISLITAISYDHPDIYPTKADYLAAFREFVGNSLLTISKKCAIMEDWGDLGYKMIENADWDLDLTGVRLEDARLAGEAILAMFPEVDKQRLERVLEKFPGSGRRFEKITAGVYSDYAHHPEEIAATIELARAEITKQNLQGLVILYQPHQNARQYEIWDLYKDCFAGADKVLWLPTFLSRENPDVRIIEPAEFVEKLNDQKKISTQNNWAEAVEMNEILAQNLRTWQEKGFLVLLMSAGSADRWFRAVFN